MTSTHVVIAHYNEDTKWTKNIKYPFTIISKEGIPQETSPNKGNEASCYLQYIFENYETLSDYTIFIHAHRTSWHSKENMDETINTLSFIKEYCNINSPVTLDSYSNTYQVMPMIIENIGKIIGKDIPINKLKYKPAAQFYVKKDLILQYSKDIYIKLYRFLQEIPIPTYYTGRAFEYTWHYIFTGNPVDFSAIK